MNELFTTYFKWNGKIINGYKLVETNGRYTLKVWKSCKKLGNWQDFMANYSLEKLIRYFENNVEQDENDWKESSSKRDEHTNKWCSLENQWRKDTLDELLLLK